MYVLLVTILVNRNDQGWTHGLTEFWTLETTMSITTESQANREWPCTYAIDLIPFTIDTSVLYYLCMHWDTASAHVHALSWLWKYCTTPNRTIHVSINFSVHACKLLLWFLCIFLVVNVSVTFVMLIAIAVVVILVLVMYLINHKYQTNDRTELRNR